MSTKFAPAERTTGWDSDDDLDHTVCGCNEDIALCGKDVSDDPWVYDGPNQCVVCEDLWDQKCPRCGGVSTPTCHTCKRELAVGEGAWLRTVTVIDIEGVERVQRYTCLDCEPDE